VVSVELGSFEGKFRAEHMPFEKSMLILCNVCHRKYDSGQVTRGRPIGAKAIAGHAGASGSANLLPITLEPSPVKHFKSRFLNHKLAELAVFYGDGRTEIRRWKASRFSKTSDVFRNLRSRPEFRQGKWQARGIVKVHVRVLGDA
jgi:hypothetical protein